MTDYVEVCVEIKNGGRQERNYTYFNNKDLTEVTINIPKKSTREIRVSHWEFNDLFNILIDKAHIKMSVEQSKALVAVLSKAIEDLEESTSANLTVVNTED